MAIESEPTAVQQGSDERVPTGIQGLDEVLHGGLIPGRTYLVRGTPGTGKTILGLQFLQTGVREGATALHILLEEHEEDIRRNAGSLGMDLDDVHFLDLSPGSDAFAEEKEYDVFAPDEVEGPDLVHRIADHVEDLAPDRVVLDPVDQLRLLAQDPYRFRKRMLAFKRLLSEQGATVLLTAQAPGDDHREDLEYLADGTVDLTQNERGRRLQVPKFRGSAVESGEHGMRIRGDGVHVYPRLRPGEPRRAVSGEQLASGLPTLDEVLHGGLERGTVTVISGPTGVGKTTLGTQFMKEASGRGVSSSIYLFEESRATFIARSEAVNLPVERMEDQGKLRAHEIESLIHSPEELGQMIRHDVEERDMELVMLDGIKGYSLSVGDDRAELAQQLHSLGRYLANRGVTVILVDEVSTVGGPLQATETGVSYLADNILFIRHAEVDDRIRKIMGVLKKRTSDFENRLLELEITTHGLRIGGGWTHKEGILDSWTRPGEEERGDGSR